MHIAEIEKPPYMRPVCCATVGEPTARWRHFVGENLQCRLVSAYEVDGVPMCKRHASEIALRAVLDKGGSI